MKLTYKEAYDKIVVAYLKDEINPYQTNRCPCGILSPDNQWWQQADHPECYPYSIEEYEVIERALFSAFENVQWVSIGRIVNKFSLKYHSSRLTITVPCGNRHTEDELFEGVCRALDALKQIHISRGEDVDSIEAPIKKREKVHATV